MEKTTIEKIITDACASLYEHEYDLVKNQAHERSLAGSIFCSIRKPFQDAGWDIDLEYNREGDDGDPKGDIIGNMVPDIIVHTRGSKLGPNLLAVEIKGYWNTANRELDQDKLRRLKAEYQYKYLYQLELKENDWELTEVDPIESESSNS